MKSQILAKKPLALFERDMKENGDMAFGFMGIMAGAAYVFFAYIGFDAVSTQAGEAKNPRKDVPFGIIVSLIFCALLYILISLVLTGMVKYTRLDITAPVAAAFSEKGLSSAVWIISIAAVAGLTSVLLVTLLGQSRLFYAMSGDGLLPKKLFGTLHRKYKTPYKGTMLTGLVVAMVAGFTPIDAIAKMVNIGTLFAFVMVCMAVWRMRYSQPHIEGPFRVKYLPLIAGLGIFFNLAMMSSLEWENWLRLFIWLAIGTIVYFLYGKKRSVIHKYLQEQETVKA